MLKDNVTLFKNSPTPQGTGTISLESVIESVKAWRLGKKKQNEKIPDGIWNQIFILLETMSESRVLGKLGIGQGQLLSKRQERQVNEVAINKTAEERWDEGEMEPVEFCEVTPKYPLDYKPAKAFSTTTSVVELYRPDGMLMKIHICTDSFEDLLRAFFKG
jgi:hypothetical protein